MNEAATFSSTVCLADLVFCQASSGNLAALALKLRRFLSDCGALACCAYCCCSLIAPSGSYDLGDVCAKVENLRVRTGQRVGAYVSQRPRFMLFKLKTSSTPACFMPPSLLTLGGRQTKANSHYSWASWRALKQAFVVLLYIWLTARPYFCFPMLENTRTNEFVPPCAHVDCIGRASILNSLEQKRIFTKIENFVLQKSFRICISHQTRWIQLIKAIIIHHQQVVQLKWSLQLRLQRPPQLQVAQRQESTETSRYPRGFHSFRMRPKRTVQNKNRIHSLAHSSALRWEENSIEMTPSK